MEKQYRVIMPRTAKQSLRDIVEYIKKDSPTAASIVRKGLIESAKSLEKLPERFAAETYLSGKKGNYRSLTRWHFKIVYKVLDDKVVILRFMHTSMNPSVMSKMD